MSRRGAGQRCAYCDRVLQGTTARSLVAATKDHTVPVSRGGRETVWACRQCNRMKADLTPAEWSAFMAVHPRWWEQGRFRRRGLSMWDRMHLRDGQASAARAVLEGIGVA